MTTPPPTPDLGDTTAEDTNRVLAVVAGMALLAVPGRTRPLAGLALAVFLSRAHGHGRDRLEATLVRLFHERSSALDRIADLEVAQASGTLQGQAARGRIAHRASQAIRAGA